MTKYSNTGRQNTKNVETQTYSMIAPELLEKVYRKYEVDFMLFGFDVNLFLKKIYPGKNITFANAY